MYSVKLSIVSDIKLNIVGYSIMYIIKDDVIISNRQNFCIISKRQT